MGTWRVDTAHWAFASLAAVADAGEGKAEMGETFRA